MEGSLDNVTAAAELPFDGGFKFSRASAKFAANSSRGSTEASVKISDGEILKVEADAKTAVVEDLILLSKAFSNPNAEAAQAAAESARTGKKKSRAPRRRRRSPRRAGRGRTFSPRKTLRLSGISERNRRPGEIGTVFMDSRAVLSGAEASFISDGSKLSLELSKAGILGASLTGELEASFDANAEIPYKIPAMSARLENFEASKIFSDAKNPPASGVFEASISARGSGNNASHLFKYLTGTATLKSAGGVLRLLSPDTAAGATADIAGTALKITGAILDKTTGRFPE